MLGEIFHFGFILNANYQRFSYSEYSEYQAADLLNRSLIEK